MKSWHKKASRVLLNHPRLVVVEDMVEIHSGKRVPYIRFETRGGGGVTVICTHEDKILVQKEYSYPVNDELYQFPGGKIENNESPEDAALRELLEESGYKATSCDELGWYYPNNRRSNVKMYVFHCKDVKRDASKSGDEEENIQSMWISFEELGGKIKNGEITNFSMLAALSLYDAKKGSRLTPLV